MRKPIWLTLCSVVIGAGVLYYAQTARATPASGFSTTYVLKGATFNEFFLFDHATQPFLPPGNNDPGWAVAELTRGHSDVYVVNNTWKAMNFDGNNGIASTGWHTHPGPSLIVVTSGTLTEYHADCVPHVHVTGETFVDPGGSDIHLIRNEGSVSATTTAVQIVPYDPAKANRRIDVPAPASCSNIQ